MTRTTSVLVIVTLSLWSPCYGDDDTAQSLNGTWLPKVAEIGGEKFPDEVRKAMTLLIADDKYTVTIGEKLDKGTVKLDRAAKPNAMDITGTEGPNNGKTFLAIYDLSGDTLKVCYDLTGKERPTEFKTQKGGLQFLVTYERKKQ